MKTQADAQDLFQVRLLRRVFRTIGGIKDPDEEETVITTKVGLNGYRRYGTMYVILDVQPLGALWPEGCTVECAKTASPARCYSEASYKIRSPKPLTEKDLEVLRAQGCFMAGQVTGACNLERIEREGDLYVYTARSVCDSGD